MTITLMIVINRENQMTRFLSDYTRRAYAKYLDGWQNGCFSDRVQVVARAFGLLLLFTLTLYAIVLIVGAEGSVSTKAFLIALIVAMSGSGLANYLMTPDYVDER